MLSITVAQQRAKLWFSKRQEDSIISFATQPCNYMNTGLGCSFLIHMKEACNVLVFGIRLFKENISMQARSTSVYWQLSLGRAFLQVGCMSKIYNLLLLGMSYL